MGVRAGPPRGEGRAPIPVRPLAARILARVDVEGAFADILLDHVLRSGPLCDPRDRGFLTELVMGTLRRRGTLDAVLSLYLDRPLHRADAFLRNALRLGAYQLLFTRVPRRAALFETVAAVKSERGERLAGVANAVLRKVAERAGGDDPSGVRGLPDDAMLSAPRPLVDALRGAVGDAEADAFLVASLEKPPFTVRSNPFRTTRDALAARLAAEGRDPSPCRYASDGIVLGSPPAVYGDPAFREGACIVMDEGAQLIAPLLSPRPGDAILDACASPGGKATHLAALSGGRARVVAADVSPGRVRILEETVKRLGAPGIETVRHDFSAGPLRPDLGLFDKVLVDAPCTGTGVIRRNPDGKWRFRPEDVAGRAALQRAILGNAWASLRPGGVLLYCTCSLLREENEEVVRAFCAEAGAVPAGPAGAPEWGGPPDAWTGDGFVRLGPHRHGTDGFFAALLGKR